MILKKILLFLNLLIIIFLLDCPITTSNIDEEEKEEKEKKKNDLSFTQPSSVPGKIDTSIVQNFPSMSDVINDPIPDYSVYGVYGWCSYFGDWWHLHEKVNDVGWKVVRVGGVKDIIDEQMTNLLNNGYEILFTITSECWDADGIYVTGNQSQTDDNFVAAFLTKLDTLLNKYGPGGSFWATYGSDKSSRIYWEIWNEPNQHYLYIKPENWDTVTMTEKARVYAKLLVETYIHVRNNSVWDSTKIIGFSACGVSRNDIWAAESPGHIGFIKMVHENVYDHYGASRAANFYDILSVHPYVHNAPPDSQDIPSQWYNYSITNSFAIYREIMDNYGNTDNPVWFTEVGWHRDTGKFPADVKPAVSERIQAAYVCRMYLTALRLGVERVHIMFLFDADNFNGGFFNYFDSNQPDLITWNESAYAVQTMVNIMPRPRIKSAISDGTDGYYAYEIDGDYLSSGENVIVAWNVEKPINVTIPCNNGIYSVINMIGGVKVINANTGSITIGIGPCPTYIVRQP